MRPPTSTCPSFGALVISLDFERHWGVRDKEPVNGPHKANFEDEQEAIRRMLDVFREFEVAATWATVGFLFADSRGQLEDHRPELKPSYENRDLCPYGERLGESEDDDPLHYAPSLIELIRRCPRQEIGSHTFSHYFCREPGQDSAAFCQDVQSAVSLAGEKGIELRSLVFPKNQVNEDYVHILYDNGMVCYRGNQRGFMYEAGNDADSNRPVKRLLRLADTYCDLAGYHTTAWSEIVQGSNLPCNIPASFFVRPFSPRLAKLDGLRLRRIEQSMRFAATEGQVIHLWWHPHDFGVHVDQNIAFLRRILALYRDLREAYQMRSLSMNDVARLLGVAA